MALMFIVFGIITICSRKPAGIYSCVKPPDLDKIRDLKAYNCAVGKLIIGYAILFIIVGFVVIFVNENTAGILLLISAFPGAIIMMIIYEIVITQKYISHK
jgi:hypothetical protein